MVDLMNRIETISRDFSCLCVPQKDILLYSGCRNCEDPRLHSLCAECMEELSDSANLKAVYAEINVNFEGNTADFGFYKAESRSLKTFLADCNKAYVFAATIGIGADRLINKYSTLSPAKAVVIDGCATAAIECWCDHLCREVFRVPEQERFSPGYGDLPLDMQPRILSYLDAGLNIGLSMTESMLLTPTKSVTAIVKKRTDS